MSRLLVLGVLLAVMLGLRTLQGESEGAHDPLILAAIGFVVMASYTAAGIGSVLKLPRVSGYIAAGVLLGPSLGNILSTRVVEDMTMFNTLALGLIALGAGLELDLAAQRKLWRTLFSTIAAKLVLSGGAVFAGFVALERIWHPLGLDSPQTMAIALVLATLSVGTSPAITLAVITETGARGRLSDLTLGAAVLKDLVLVVLLAIAIAIGTGLIGGGSGHSSVLEKLATELGGSVAIGGMLGVLIIGYVRFIREEMLLFVAGLVLAAAELSRALHLDLLLVFIGAGFVVRNFSKRWEEVLHAIETVALPVFVVFFTIAGARIDLEATARLLPFALGLSSLRALAFFAAARIGARVGREPDPVKHLAVLAYLPQAGVTLGLLAIACDALGAVSKPLADIGLACVAINLAIGPVTQRRALQLAAQKPEPEDAQDRESKSATPAPQQRPTQERVSVETGHRELDRPLQRLQDNLLRVVDELIRDRIRPHIQAMSTSLATVFDSEDHRVFVQRLHGWAQDRHAVATGERAVEAARSFHSDVLTTLGRVAVRRTVPFDPALLDPQAGDGLRLRVRKLRWRLRHRLSRKTPTRRVPLRTAAKVALAPRLASLSLQLSSNVCRTHSRVLRELRLACAKDVEPQDAIDAITQHFSDLVRDVRSDAEVAIEAGLVELMRISADVDSPSRPLSHLRYSNVEPEVRARELELQQSAAALVEALSAAEQGVVRDAVVVRLREAADEMLEREVLLPLADAAEALEPAVAETRNKLREALERLRGPDASDALLHELHEDFQRALSLREKQPGYRKEPFRAAASLHAASSELRSLVDALPEELRVISSSQEVHELPSPIRASSRATYPRSDARRSLIDDFLPTLDLESRRAAAAVQDLDARVTEALEMAASVVRAGDEEEPIGLDAADNALEIALGNLEQGTTQARNQLITAHEAISTAFQDAFERLGGTRAGPLELRAARTALTRPMGRALGAARSKLAAVLTRARTALRWALGTELAQRFKNRLDTPQDLRALLARDVAEAVPASYARLFRLEPEQDLRHCVGRDEQLQWILDAQSRWKGGSRGAVLIAGDPGSGRTTLINTVQREIVAARLLRPESARSRRKEGLTRALAYELGRAPSQHDLAAALRSEPTAVLVDDLEHWFTPDHAGLHKLRSFLGLIRSTRSDVFWVVSASSQMLDLLRGVVAAEEVFGDVVRLQPLSVSEVRRAIESRHALSGLTLVLPRAPGALTNRLLRQSEGQLVFRALHSVSAGNIGTALSLWINSVRVEDKRVHVMFDQLLSQRLPHLFSFDAETIGLLVQLHRFGPMSAGRLSDALGVPVWRVRTSLVRLEDAGLVRPSAGSEITLRAEWRGVLAARLPTATEWRG